MPVSLGYAIFYVPDVSKATEFYRQAFDLPVKFVTPENDYGELDTGSTTLAFVSNELADTNLAAAGGFARLDAAGPPVGASITLVGEDVQAMVNSAVAAGATIYVEPVEKPWGQTVSYVIDPHGLLLELATPVG